MTLPIVLASPFRINSDTQNNQIEPKIVGLKDGSFLAVWVNQGSLEDIVPSGSDPGLVGQVFNADGSAKGDAFQINNDVSSSAALPDITVLSDGRFAVAWVSGTNEVHARIFNADASPYDRGDGHGSGEFTVGTISNSNALPTIQSLGDGCFAVTYYQNQDKVQSFSASGQILGEAVTVKPIEAGDARYSFTLASSGGYNAFYYDYKNNQIAGHGFAADGQSSSSEFSIAATNNFVTTLTGTLLADHRIALIWTEQITEGGVITASVSKAQILDTQGHPAGPVLSIGSGNENTQKVVAITALPNGGFGVAFMTWESSPIASFAGGDTPIHLRLAFFNAAGEHLGDDLEVAQNPASASLSTLADGHVAITWTNDASGDSDVYGEIIDPNLLPASNGGSGSGGTVDSDPHHHVGGFGNDVFTILSPEDTFSDPGGIDTVWTSFSYTLPGGLENLSGLGSVGLSLTGNAAANRITGTAGNDTLKGAGGHDTLTGGAGKDTFLLDAKIAKAHNTTIATIDFQHKQDRIWLSHTVFKGIGKGSLKKPAHLKADYFTAHKSAQDASDHILYDPKSGKLFYDADGTGHQKPVEIADLPKHIKGIAASDFFVV